MGQFSAHRKRGKGTEDKKYDRRWRTLAVLSVSLVILGLDVTILNVALPTIQRDLHASASELQWMVDAYVLIFAGLLLTMGALGDRFGRKRALQAGLLIFGVSSVFAAFAGSPAELIVARAIMGFGGALIMPSTLSVIVDVFPEDERGKAIGIWTGMAAVGIAGGPVMGGWLVETFWWGSVFFVNVPVLIFALAVGWMLVPESRDPAAPRLDYPGSLLSSGTLLALIYAIIEAPSQGWFSAPVAASFLLAIMLGAAFVYHELRTDHPMLELRLFLNRRLSAGVTLITLAFFTLYGMIFIVTQYLQFARGYSAVEAGLLVAPLALGLLVGAANSHRLVSRFGSHRVIAFGFVVLSVMLVSLALWNMSTPWWVVTVSMVGLAFGIGNVMAPATDAVMGAVPEAKAGIGSALNDTARQVGGAFGIAVLGSILNQIYSSNVSPAITTLPDGPRQSAGDSIGAAVAIAAQTGGVQGQALLVAAQDAFLDGMTLALGLAAAVAVAGIAVSLRFMPGRRESHSHAAGQTNVIASRTAGTAAAMVSMDILAAEHLAIDRGLRHEEDSPRSGVRPIHYRLRNSREE